MITDEVMGPYVHENDLGDHVIGAYLHQQNKNAESNIFYIKSGVYPNNILINHAVFTITDDKSTYHHINLGKGLSFYTIPSDAIRDKVTFKQVIDHDTYVTVEYTYEAGSIPVGTACDYLIIML